MPHRPHATPFPRLLLPGLVLAVLAACGRTPPAAPASPPVAGSAAPVAIASEHGPLELREVVTGLVHPWALAFLPDGSMLVSERPGRLQHVSADAARIVQIRGVPRVYADGQAGLLDVALSPRFGEDRLVYLAFAEPNLRGNLCGTAVARGRLVDEALQEVEVIYRQQPKLSAGSHLGARLVFDDAGHLFVTQGDNRTAPEAAQALDKLQGKLVRVMADGAIPQDNPFTGHEDARAEIWSYGHRNIQGAALHPQTRRLWTSEHGPMGGDELNLPLPGRNYGWPLATDGLDYSGAAVPGSRGRSVPGMEAPHHVWKKSPALSGMAFYTADALPQWRGNLLLGALADRELIRLELDGERVVHEERLLGQRRERIRDVRQGPDGAVYLLTDEPRGKLLRLGPQASPAGTPPPLR